MEGEVAFSHLLARFPDIHLGAPREELAWCHGDGLVIRALNELPVVLGPDRGR